ncbi:hypothetical protein AHAS_Ahas07G0127700 [Arachis hypogaea]
MVKRQNKLQEFARKMDGSFVDELHKLGIPCSIVDNFQSSSLLDESVVIERESDKREVIKLLLDEKMEGRSNLLVIAIVERVTRSIVECACREKVKLSDLEQIQMRLEEILNGKKFLIVLDGFWDEDEHNWDMLCLPFRVAARRSRVLVTTHRMLVLRVVATASAY